MKALTLYQPWATLWAIGAKTIETRSWETAYRGPLAIHAGMKRNFIDMRSAYYVCNREPFYSVLMDYGKKAMETLPPWDILPLGKIIGITNIIDCVDIGPKFISALTEQEKAFGNYSLYPHRWAWISKNTKALEFPIPARGAMGLWEWNGGRNEG